MSNHFTRRSFLPAIGSLVVGSVFFSSFRSGKATTKAFTNKLLPPALQKGDTIGVCATAGATLDPNYLSQLKSFLEKQGYNVRLSRTTKGSYGYFSAPDKERASDFMELITDKQIKAIFFARGGWGCARILDLLDYSVIQENPKIILGFSDITSLLNTITQRTSLITFHGPNSNSTWEGFSWDQLAPLLTSDYKPFLQVPKGMELKFPIPSVLYPGTASGKLLGGNLSVLVNLIGTEWEPDWSESILFLEDVHEEPYKIDKMLFQLKASGVFNKVNGIVLGQFRDCEPEDPSGSFSLSEVFLDYFKALGKPVLAGLPFGHIVDKYSLPIGIDVTLSTEKQGIQLNENSVAL